MAKNWLTKLYDGIATRALAPAAEQRTSLENPQTPLSYPAEWLLDIFNGGRTDSGIRVSEMTALQVGTVFACCNVISDGVSSLPLHVYQRAKIAGRASKTLAVDSPIYDLVHTEPNPEMSSAVFFKVLMVHALLWGNGYAEIQRDNRGQIIAIWPRNPARTRPIRLLKPLMFEGDLLPAGTMMYETSDQLMDSSSYVVDQNPEMMNVGLRRLVLMDNIIHVTGLSLDGRLGQSTVWLARQAFGLALATEKYGAKFFGNGARPSGILTMPSKPEDKNIDTMRRSWAEAHGGENQFKVAVLEAGITYTKIQSTPEEGQMLETRKYEREEICAIFGVPAHMVAASDKSGKSNVEQSSIEFVLYCLHPWLNRIEQELERKLFADRGRHAGKFFAKFDTRKLMYPDAAARAQFYAGGKQWGFLNTNMILELEDMNPVEDKEVGEKFWMPINMQDASDPQKLGAEDQNDLDIKKATVVAEHGAQMQQDTAKVTTNLQMKSAQQSHEHAMEAGDAAHKQTLQKAKAGIMPPPTPGTPAAPGAPAAEPAAPAADKKQKRSLSNPTEVRQLMEELTDEGFVFVSQAKAVEGGTTYRYAHPDQREMYLTYKPGKDSSDAAGTVRENIIALYASDPSMELTDAEKKLIEESKQNG
jgi:HK97 family phage portal protein